MPAPLAPGPVLVRSDDELPRRAWVEQVMGLPVSIHVRGPAAHATPTERAVSDIFTQLHEVDRRFSTYRADSEVSARRGGAAGPPSPELGRVLALCEEARRRTRGAFDADLPSGFDPSGLVKGWALERAARHLADAAHGSDWLVNGGGDITLHAEPGRTWQVGIEDPRDPSRTLRTFALADGAIATSGCGRRGAHIIDPATGQPARGTLLSATVLAPSLLWADVYATAAYVDGVESLSWLTPLGPLEVLLVRADGSLVSTRAVTGTRPVRDPLLVPLQSALRRSSLPRP